MIQFLAGLFLGLVVVMVLIVLRLDWDGARRVDAIDAAQDMDIGEGVTLSEGLKAFFGGETHWMATDGKSVRVRAGMNRPAASLYVYPETGEIEILMANSKNGWEDERGRKALLELMVKAAKDRETILNSK